MIALDFTEKRVVLTGNFIAVDNCVCTLSGSARMIQYGQVVKRLSRSGEALFLVACGFAAAAANTACQVYQYAHGLRISTECC
jgi:hypothetical protein